MPEIWKRQPSEPTDAHRAFCRYRDMGWDPKKKTARKRSLKRLADRIRKTERVPGGSRWGMGRLKTWSRMWNWVARCDAYDEHMRDVEQQAREDVTREKARDEWNDWYEAQRRDIRDMIEEVKGKLRQMAKFPLATVEVAQEEGGGVKQVVKPARWSFDTWLRGHDMVAKTAALIAEKPTERQHVTGNVEDEMREELRKILGEPDVIEAAETIAKKIRDER